MIGMVVVWLLSCPFWPWLSIDIFGLTEVR
jgi:hypothetical protein